MNNPKLIQALADTGFPLKKRSVEVVDIPTLLELIEACGDSFDKLDYMQDGDNGFFMAFMSDEAFDEYQEIYTPCMKECCGYGSGETAEEAVADLYITLSDMLDSRLRT